MRQCIIVVTYITVDSSKTGVGKYAYDLYTLMAPESRIVQFIFNNKFQDPLYKSPYRGLENSVLNYLFSDLIYKSGIKAINNCDDIIHITSQTIKPMFKSKYMVVTIHDIIAFTENINDLSSVEKLRRIGMRKYIDEYLKYDNIITISDSVKHEISTRFNINESKISVISPYISDNFYPLNRKDELRKELGLPLNKKLVLSVSSDQPRKNLSMVRELMDRLGEEYQLVRIGVPVGNSITFTDVDAEKINKIYGACDILFFPTLAEGFGYPVVEAFKTGLPVLSSDIDVIREVSDGAALLVNPKDIKGNVEGVYKVLDNSDYYRNKGFERAEYYSRDAIRNKLLSYYHSIK